MRYLILLLLVLSGCKSQPEDPRRGWILIDRPEFRYEQDCRFEGKEIKCEAGGKKNDQR